MTGAAELRLIVAFDPGKNVGVAFVTSTGELTFHGVLSLTEVTTLPLPGGAHILVGDGTGSAKVQDLLRRRGLSYEVVDERGSSLAARSLYFRDHPPRGWRRLLPPGMRTPPELTDDYAAYALALAYLAKKSEGSGQP